MLPPSKSWPSLLFDNLVPILAESCDELESETLFRRLSNSSAALGGGKGINAPPTFHINLKNEWWNSHLTKADLESRIILENHLRNLLPNVNLSAPDVDAQLLKFAGTESEKAAITIKSLCQISIRLFQWSSLVNSYLSRGLNRIEDIFQEEMERVKQEFQSRTKLMSSKLESTDKMLRLLKESLMHKLSDSPQSSTPSKPTPKQLKEAKDTKELERLKVKIIALEKQNSYLVSREKDLENKLHHKSEGGGKKKSKDAEGLKEKENAAGGGGKETAKEQTKKGVMVFDMDDVKDPIPPKKKSSASVKKVLVSKQEKQDRFEASLLEYTALLSASVINLPILPPFLMDSTIYSSFLEMIVEILPKIDKRKEVIIDKTLWFKNILELANRMILNKGKVRWSEEQELVGIPESLPLKLAPKTSFWVKVIDSKSSLLCDVINESEHTGKLIVQESVTRKLVDILTGIVNYIRVKMAETNEKIASIKSTTAETVTNSTAPQNLKSVDVKSSIRKIKELIQSKGQLAKSLIMCYVFIERCMKISHEQEVYFNQEIEELVSEKNWKDLPLIGSEIRSWFKNIPKD